MSLDYLPGALKLSVGDDGKISRVGPPAPATNMTWYHPSVVLTREYKQTVTVAGTPSDPPGLGKPTIVDGATIPFVIGQQRIPAALVSWYGNLRPVEEVTTELTNTQTESLRTFETYFATDNFITTDTLTVTRSIVGWQADVVMLLCLGPDVELLAVYKDGETVWSGTLGVGRHEAQWDDTDLLAQGMIWHSGQYDQVPDPYLQEWVDPNVSAFPGIAYVILRGVNLTENFPALTFEVRRVSNPLGLSDEKNYVEYVGSCGLTSDLNLATMAYEVITSDWGGIGLDASTIDLTTFSETAVVLAGELNCGSLYNQEDTSGSRLLEMIEQQANGVIFENSLTGKIEFRLYRKPEDTSGLFELNPNNIVSLDRLSKQAWDNLPNSVVVSYTHRCANYSQGSFPLDLPIPEGFPRREARVDYPLAMDYAIAQRCAVRDMPYMTSPMWEFSVEVHRSAAHLRPGDVVKFSWPEYRIEGVIATITNKTESKEDGKVTLEYFILLDAYTRLLVNGDVTEFEAPDPSPKKPVRGFVVSAPFWVAYQAGFKYKYYSNIDRDVPLYLVEPENLYQRKMDIFQYDHPLTPDSWTRFDRNIGYATLGILETSITQWQGWTDGIIPEVYLTGVDNDFYLQSVGYGGAKSGRALMVIGDEFFAFEGAEKTGATSWTLTNVHRALFGRAFGNHSAGAFIGIISNDYQCVGSKSFAYEYPTPEEVTLKALSWGMSQREKNPILDGRVLTPNWTPTDQLRYPYRPDDTRIDGVRTQSPITVTIGVPFDLTWKVRNRSVLNTIPFFADNTHLPEVDGSGNVQVHRVWVEDTLDDYIVGTAPDGNSLITITPDGDWEPGPAEIWVQSSSAGRNSIHQDRLAINIVE